MELHTDEYTITLSRELAVCRGKIASLQKKLARMEKKFNMKSAAFVKDFNEGKIDRNSKDFIKWYNDCESFIKWKEKLRQYEEIFHSMKV